MRYEETDTIKFTTIDGKELSIKDIREYESLESVAKINVYDSKFIDEIATREDVYGEESEFESYKIADQNIVNLFENSFDITKIKTLGIPS